MLVPVRRVISDCDMAGIVLRLTHETGVLCLGQDLVSCGNADMRINMFFQFEFDECNFSISLY